MNNVNRTFINLIFGITILMLILFTIFFDVVTIIHTLPVGVIVLSLIWLQLWYGNHLVGYWDFLKHDDIYEETINEIWKEMIEEIEEVKHYKSLLTTSKPYTLYWWIELLGHAIVRDTLSVERMQWKDAERYNKLVKFIHNRIGDKLDEVIDKQRQICSREYLESTYDSNNFEYKGKPLRNYVHDLIRNSRKPEIK